MVHEFSTSVMLDCPNSASGSIDSMDWVDSTDCVLRKASPSLVATHPPGENQLPLGPESATAAACGRLPRPGGDYSELESSAQRVTYVGNTASYQPSAVSPQLLYEGCEHPLDFDQLAHKLFVAGALQVVEVMSKQEVILELAS